MPSSSSSLPSQIASSFDASIQAGHITLYASTSSTPVSHDPRAGPGEEGAFKQWVHVVPDLVDKPAVPPKTPDLSKVGKKDVFAGPEFGPGERILTLDTLEGEFNDEKEGEEGDTYSLVHNLHALFPEHILLIPTFSPSCPFRPQTSDLRQRDLAVAWEVVEAYEKEGETEAICFFNGGPLAGASQAHLHLQFTPFQHGCPPAVEALARSIPFPHSSPSPPSAPETYIPATPARLPLPWVHFYLPVPPRPSSSSPSLAEKTQIRRALYAAYQSLLSHLSQFLSSRSPSELPEEGQKRNSYNLFLTSSHLHLIPRRSRLVRIPRVKSLEKDKREGEEFVLSTNGLVMMGYWFAGSDEEREDLLEYGLGRGLRESGYENEGWGNGREGEEK
ncbi:hypothetical protein JCM8547_003742 [Rhodosporidiobolus lusitaniae]